MLLNVAYYVVDGTLLHYCQDSPTSYIPYCDPRAIVTVSRVTDSVYKELSKATTHQWYYDCAYGLTKKDSPESHDVYSLLSAKIEYTNKILWYINYIRKESHVNLIGHSDVMRIRHSQAVAVLDDPTIDPGLVPLVQSHSTLHNCSLEQSAKTFMLLHREYEHILVKTEIIRERWLSDLDACNTVDQIAAKFSEIYSEYYLP